MTSDKKISH